MKVYKETIQTVVATQYSDPVLNHITAKIISHLVLAKGKRLLDLGCGVGRVELVAATKGFTTIGIDFEPKAIDLARTYAKRQGLAKRCLFIVGDILETPSMFREQFDVIICSEVIEHVKRPEKIIHVAFQLLRENGTLIVTTPHDQKLWSPLDKYAGHVKRFSLQEIEKLLAKFRIIHLYTIGFPLMRSIIRLYTLFSKKTGRVHTASWRKDKINNYLYATIMSYALKFDDLFNHQNKGTTIIAIVQKSTKKK